MATSVLARPYVTLDAFYAMDHESDYVELADGVVVVSPSPRPIHGWIIRNLFRALDAHVTARGLGDVYADGIGYELPVPSRPDTARTPDLSFVRAGRIGPLDPEMRALALAPDLAVEVVSPSEHKKRLHSKLNDYLDAGAALVWVVNPRRRTVEVLTPGVAPGRGRVLREGEALDGGAVLPGFAIPVAAVFAGLRAG